jgi:hemin uptake protein HemP
MNKKFSYPITSLSIGHESDLSSTQVPHTRLHSKKLFGEAREIIIEHAGDEYRLRLTRLGKLILTK